MLSLQEALDLDLDAMTSGFEFTPWEADTCPTLEQLMASPSSSAEAEGVVEEERRRQRRKISNRLSAQRSRARKQQRLEELRATAARLRAENRELADRLRSVARYELPERCQNTRLRAEAAALARRLLVLQRLARLVPPPTGAVHGAEGAACTAPAAPVGLASLMT